MRVKSAAQPLSARAPSSPTPFPGFSFGKLSTRMVNRLSAAIYLLAGACVLVNVYVLLNRSDTIHYLRIYHLAVGALMVSAGALQLLFMFRANRCFPKLKSPYTIPRPTLVSAFALTVGIALGYAYFLVFNIAFSNCDKMIDATGAEEQWQEAIYNLLMISFCVLSLIYIWQRAYFGAQHQDHFDLVTRKWVNVVLTIVWIKIVVYKGYLSYQELCQRKEISGYWCPIIKRPYTCDPENALKGTQKIWYYLHKGLLNSAIISCASEFFPVMLVAHWLACGRAEQRADELIRRRQEKKSVRRMLHGMIGDVSKVYGVDPSTQHRRELPVLEIRPALSLTLLALSWLVAVLVTVRWFVGLYSAINYDLMAKSESLLDDYVESVTTFFQMLLFFLLWLWASNAITFKRWDPHHKAEARGDLVLIGGSAAFMSLKFVLQLLELQFQRADGFLPWREAFLRTFALTVIHASQWLQFFCLRRVMALHFEDVHTTRFFLPSISLVAIVINWVGFGMTFFETNTIKYQLGLSEHHFSQSTLISMIFTQTIYPADYLFCFTAAGCWTDVILRYVEMGLFQLGPPVDLDELEEEHQHKHSHAAENGKRHAHKGARRGSNQPQLGHEDNGSVSSNRPDRPIHFVQPVFAKEGEINGRIDEVEVEEEPEEKEREEECRTRRQVSWRRTSKDGGEAEKGSGLEQGAPGQGEQQQQDFVTRVDVP